MTRAPERDNALIALQKMIFMSKKDELAALNRERRCARTILTRRCEEFRREYEYIKWKRKLRHFSIQWNSLVSL